MTKLIKIERDFKKTLPLGKLQSRYIAYFIYFRHEHRK